MIVRSIVIGRTVDQSLFKLSFHHSNSRRIGNYNMTVSTKNIDIISNVSDKVIGP